MGPRLVVIKLVNTTLRVINFVHMDLLNNIVRNMIVTSNFAKKEETLIMLMKTGSKIKLLNIVKILINFWEGILEGKNFGIFEVILKRNFDVILEGNF